MGNKYIKVSTGLYINYFIYGMVNIMLASHMTFLTEQLNTDKSGISFLVAAIGMGRLLTLYVSGLLSDKFGRKPFILSASILMSVFLIGIPLSPSYEFAVVLAFLAGVANSMLDSGSYPALMEAFPKTPGTATVFVRGVIAIGSMLLPLMILFFMDNNIYYGMAFFLPALIFLINTIYLGKMKFPEYKIVKEETNQIDTEDVEKREVFNMPRFWQEGICLILIGFTGPALLYILQLWLPTFGQEAIGMTQADSLKLLSYYSVGSLLSVGTLVIVLHRFVKPVTVIIVYPVISLVGIVSLILFKTPLITTVCSFVIGFSISGILQLALTVMSEFFGEKKGQITGFIYTATSVAYTVIPLITGVIVKNGSVVNVFLVAIIVNVIGIGLASLVLYRYAKVFYAKKVSLVRWVAFIK